MNVSTLPLPHLEARTLDTLHILTDDALAQTLGVRVAFTGRAGGVSEGAYAGLNLASHVGDNVEDVLANRALLMGALGVPDMPLVVPNQVHGSHVVFIDDAGEEAVAAARVEAQERADAIAVSVSGVAALLCFADCVPVIVVSPTGAFSVIHAGWRGTLARICSKAVRALACAESQGGAAFAGAPASFSAASACSASAAPFATPEEAASQYNVYVGPHIHAECFETGADVRASFAEKFGDSCVLDESHVSMLRAIRADVVRAGVSPERIVDAGVCTVCRSNEFYSYRASGGVCGRHGAIAFRESEVL